MKKIIFILCVSIVLFSCEKYPEPGRQTLEQFNFNIIGNNQSAEEGEYLPLEIGVQIDLNYLIPEPDKKFHMKLEVIKGGGIIENSIIEADNEGKMVTKWQLGHDLNDQVVACQIFDSDGKLYSEFNIEATAFLLDQWNTVTKGYLVGIMDMVRDTINQQSMLKSGGNLYVSTDNFYTWEPLNFSYNTNIKELEINSEGEIFAAGWNGDLYRTSDWGKTWIHLGKPIPENPHHYELSISNDDYIWANKWQHGVYCSKDNGLNWTKDTIGLIKQEELGHVFSFADTSHVAISYHNLTIHKTTDDGISWQPLNTPEYSLSMYVTSNNTLIVQNQEGAGFTLHKSTDGGETYKKVFSPNVAFGTKSKHCYDKFKNEYYVLAPGGGVWKTKDFEEYEKLITFSQQRNLFIDHRGTIYASGYNYSNAPDEPTYILPQNE